MTRICTALLIAALAACGLPGAPSPGPLNGPDQPLDLCSEFTPDGFHPALFPPRARRTLPADLRPSGRAGR